MPHGISSTMESHVIKPTSSPEDGPIGFVNNYEHDEQKHRLITSVFLEAHVERITKPIEQKLIHVSHADWENNKHWLSPYADRAKDVQIDHTKNKPDKRDN